MEGAGAASFSAQYQDLSTIHSIPTQSVVAIDIVDVVDMRCLSAHRPPLNMWMADRGCVLVASQCEPAYNTSFVRQ